MAASALGKDAADMTFSAAPPVPASHSGASALIAAGFLAAITGEPTDPSAALAGVLHPDGTIGPVAGLPELLAGAIARGKTRFGYPSGMRLARSLATGKEVDLVQLAREHRAEAVELANVYDAYHLVTRASLPAPVPVSEAEMALDPQTLERLRARYATWRELLARQWPQILQLEQSGRLPAAVKLRVRLAHERSQEAEALHRAGQLPAAGSRMAAAWVSAAAANAAHAVLRKLAAGDIDGAANVLAQESAARSDRGASPVALLERIGAREPSTLAGHLARIAAFQAALRAWSYDASGAEAMRAAAQLLDGFRGKASSELASPAIVEAVASAVVSAQMLRLRAVVEADTDQALELDQGVPYGCSPEDVRRIAAVFRAAAAAGLRHVDGLLVDPLARRIGLTEHAARQRVASGEPDYRIADALSRIEADSPPHELAMSWGERSVSASLLALAGHHLAYRQSALLIAKYESLGAHVDTSGRIDAVVHTAALRNLLTGASRAARASARAARIATGAIPLEARLAYQLASVAAAGSVGDQIDALAQLWTASAFSQIAVMLARN